MHQTALHIDRDYVPQTVRRFAGNVFGADLVAVQAQHPHLGKFGYVDHTAKAAQGEVCKMQEHRGKDYQRCSNTESSNYKELEK